MSHLPRYYRSIVLLNRAEAEAIAADLDGEVHVIADYHTPRYCVEGGVPLGELACSLGDGDVFTYATPRGGELACWWDRTRGEWVWRYTPPTPVLAGVILPGTGDSEPGTTISVGHLAAETLALRLIEHLDRLADLCTDPDLKLDLLLAAGWKFEDIDAVFSGHMRPLDSDSDARTRLNSMIANITAEIRRGGAR